MEATLDFFLGQIYPLSRLFVLAHQDRSRLKSIKFIEVSLVGDIADEMIDIRLFLLLSLILIEDEGLSSTETIVDFSDRLRVAEHKPSVFGGEFLGEVVELLQCSLDGDGGVEEDR